jgi:phosphatidylethanolamine/phosphatidyl-N-methylethanolamine N-methyltransferase
VQSGIAEETLNFLSVEYDYRKNFRTMKPTESFYNRFAVFYPAVDVFLRRQKKALFDGINTLQEGHLLEIGVGNGGHLPLYKKHKVVGIDTSAAMLAIASKRNINNAQLLRMNGEDLLFEDDQFDYVVLSHVIAVVDNPEQLLAEVFRVLRPNGTLFVLNHFTPDNWLKYIDYAFKPVSKRFHFKSVFHIQEIKTINKFKLLKEVFFPPASYFKLLIYQKK